MISSLGVVHFDKFLVKYDYAFWGEVELRAHEVKIGLHFIVLHLSIHVRDMIL